MKNILKNTLYLSVFVLAGILFQISCSNSDDSSRNNSSTPVGKIVYETGTKIMKANYDGTNATEIPINLPANIIYNFGKMSSSLSVSPDGNTIFFTCSNTTYPYVTTELYSCDINGGNAVPVITVQPASSDSEHVGHSIAF